MVVVEGVWSFFVWGVSGGIFCLLFWFLGFFFVWFFFFFYLYITVTATNQVEDITHITDCHQPENS